MVINSSLIDSNLVNYPVFVFLNESTNWEYIQDNLNDLRFGDSDNNTLSFEVYSYTVNVNTSVWVEVLEISNTTDTLFYCYFGNPFCGSGEGTVNPYGSVGAVYWDDETLVTPTNGYTFVSEDTVNQVEGSSCANITLSGGDGGVFVSNNGSMIFPGFSHLSFWLDGVDNSDYWSLTIIAPDWSNYWGKTWQDTDPNWKEFFIANEDMNIVGSPDDEDITYFYVSSLANGNTYFLDNFTIYAISIVEAYLLSGEIFQEGVYGSDLSSEDVFVIVFLFAVVALVVALAAMYKKAR